MEDAIIISDVHLGSGCCEVESLLEFLHWAQTNTKKLILNGDVFDNMNFHRLNKHHWHILSRLRKMSDKIEVIWIAGNHDGPATTISSLIGLHVSDEYILTSGGKKIMITHGDVWDKFISERPILTWIGDIIYSVLQKIGHKYARWAKNSSKHYLHCQEIVRDGATKHAKKHGCDAVCCGHTHSTYDDGFYYNSGCWTEPPGTYLTVRNGGISINSWKHENPKLLL